MPTLTLEEVLAAQAALPDLAKQPGIPAKDAFALAKLAQRLNAEVAAYQEVKNRLMEMYGVKDKVVNGQTFYRFEGEGLEEWNRQYGELIAQTVELPSVKIKLSTLGPIAPATLLPLLWLIEDDTEGAETVAAAAP